MSLLWVNLTNLEPYSLCFFTMYKITEAKESITSTERKRRIEGADKIKKPKKIKTPPAEPKAKPDENGGGESKDLSEGQAKRVSKALEVVEERLLHLNEALILAGCEDMKPHMIPSLLARAGATRDQLEKEAQPKLQAVHEAQRTTKESYAELFDLVKGTTQDAKEFAKKLKQMVADSKADMGI